MKKNILFILCFLSLSISHYISTMDLPLEYQLVNACDKSDEDLLKNLIMIGTANPATYKTVAPTTWDYLLTTFIRRNQNDLAKLLLDAGVNPNSVDNRGYTPLVAAVLHENKKGFDLLIKAKADVNLHLVNPQTDECLKMAIGNGDLEMISKLIAAEADITNGLTAAQSELAHWLSGLNNPSYSEMTERIQERIEELRTIVSFFENIARAAAQAGPAHQESKEEDAVKGAQEDSAPPRYEDVVPE